MAFEVIYSPELLPFFYILKIYNSNVIKKKKRKHQRCKHETDPWSLLIVLKCIRILSMFCYMFLHTSEGVSVIAKNILIGRWKKNNNLYYSMVKCMEGSAILEFLICSKSKFYFRGKCVEILIKIIHIVQVEC